MGLHDDHIGKRLGVVDAALQVAWQKIGKPGFVITRIQKWLEVPLAARAVAESQETQAHAFFSPEGGQQGHVVGLAGATVPDVQIIQPFHGVEHADFAVVNDMVVAKGDEVHSGIADAGDVLGLAAEDHALGGVWCASVGVGHLEIGHIDVGGLPKNFEGGGVECFDAVGVDEATIVFVAAAGENISDEIHCQGTIWVAGGDGNLAGVAGGHAG